MDQEKGGPDVEGPENGGPTCVADCIDAQVIKKLSVVVNVAE